MLSLGNKMARLKLDICQSELINFTMFCVGRKRQWKASIDALQFCVLTDLVNALIGWVSLQMGQISGGVLCSLTLKRTSFYD